MDYLFPVFRKKKTTAVSRITRVLSRATYAPTAFDVDIRNVDKMTEILCLMRFFVGHAIKPAILSGIVNKNNVFDRH